MGNRRSNRARYQPSQPPSGSPVLARENVSPKPLRIRNTATAWNPTEATATYNPFAAQPSVSIVEVGAHCRRKGEKYWRSKADGKRSCAYVPKKWKNAIHRMESPFMLSSHDS